MRALRVLTTALLFSLFSAVATPGHAVGIISTVAGGGSGDGGAATAAGLSVHAVAVDSNGNLYIADVINNRIRKVDNATGIISTVAGNGIPGFSGDGGAATLAQLKRPSEVAVDAAGNLYIYDNFNNRIRKVDNATGIISTVAGNGFFGFSADGGAATLAEVGTIFGLAVDAAGNLYFSEFNHNRVRKVDSTTGLISTVAGNGIFGFSGDGGPATSAQLANPRGVAVDVAGNLYIAEFRNNRIRKVDSATGLISTVAGNGIFGFSGDGGAATLANFGGPSAVAVDAAGNLYIADHNNSRIRKVDSTTGIISTVAGNGFFGFSGDGGPATLAQLNIPIGLAVDAADNLYIADGANNRIRKVNNATGLISTVAGNGLLRFNGDGGAATLAQLGGPFGLAVDAAGNLYISEIDNNRIRKVDSATGLISTVAGNGIPGFFAGFSGDGGAATLAQLSFPRDVVVDAAGNLYIADLFNSRIRKVDSTTGLISTVAGNGIFGFSGDGGPATLAQLGNPSKVAVDAVGNVYIAVAINNRIRKVESATGIISTVAGNGFLGFSGDGGPATLAQIASPRGVAVDAAGNLYIADFGNNRIRKVTSAPAVVVDTDGDGIEDAIDGTFTTVFNDQSTVPSDNFTDQHLGGLTFGTIVTRNGNVLNVTDDATDGVLLEAIGGTDGAPQIVQACSSPVVDIFLTDGDQIIVTCGSFTGKVLAGPVISTVGTNIGVTIPAGTIVFIEEPADSIISITHLGETGSPDIVINDKGIITNLGPDDATFMTILDADVDGVRDIADVCPATVIPEAAPTSNLGLNKNRWSLQSANGIFTQAPPQEGSVFSFTTTDTRGCSCEQIIDAAGLGKNHLSRGCSTSAMLDWINNP